MPDDSVMFDFLCVLPHGCASHSILHYLNQHKFLHIARHLAPQPDNIFKEEALLRPWVRAVGAAIKNYHLIDANRRVLDATKRDLVIQTTRDPIESFLSFINNALSERKFNMRTEDSTPQGSMDEQITRALEQMICPHAAELACDVDSFKEHILIDVCELRGSGSEQTVRRLWKRICGDDDDQNLVSKSFAPLGSRPYFYLFQFPMKASIAGEALRVIPVPEGELRIGSLIPGVMKYHEFGEPLHVFPDINTLLPSLKLTGPLYMRIAAHEWNMIHPKARPFILKSLIPEFERVMRKFDLLFAEAEKARTFTIDQLTAAQRSLLAKGLADDFAAFRRRHRDVAESWQSTRAFLGV